MNLDLNEFCYKKYYYELSRDFTRDFLVSR